MSKLSCLCTAVFTTHDISGKLQRQSRDSSPRCGLHIGETIGSLFALIFFQVKRHDIYWKQFLRFKSLHLKRDRILCLNSTFVLIYSNILSVYPPAMIVNIHMDYSYFAPILFSFYMKLIFYECIICNERYIMNFNKFTVLPCVA